jgi:hypothetical protein
MWAQKGDFELWASINQKFGIYKDFKFTLTEESRFNHNVSSLKQLFVVGDISYDVTKRFTVSTAYKLRRRYDEAQVAYTDHIFTLDASYDVKIKRFTLNSRSRYEYGKEEEDLNYSNINTYVREKLTLDYNIYKTALEPYMSIEGFFPTESGKIYRPDAYRWFIGAKYPFQNHRISAAYGIDKGLTGKQKTKYILALEYLYKF